MTQYCRYCAYCCYGDVVYCEIKEKTMSEEQAKQPNNCKDFGFCEIDVFTGKKYQPRKAKESNYKQMNLFEEGEQNQ